MTQICHNILSVFNIFDILIFSHSGTKVGNSRNLFLLLKTNISATKTNDGLSLGLCRGPVRHRGLSARDWQ